MKNLKDIIINKPYFLKELIKITGIDCTNIRSADSRTATLKTLKQYMDLELPEGSRKYIVKEIYDNPLKRQKRTCKIDTDAYWYLSDILFSNFLARNQYRQKRTKGSILREYKLVPDELFFKDSLYLAVKCVEQHGYKIKITSYKCETTGIIKYSIDEKYNSNTFKFVLYSFYKNLNKRIMSQLYQFVNLGFNKGEDNGSFTKKDIVMYFDSANDVSKQLSEDEEDIYNQCYELVIAKYGMESSKKLLTFNNAVSIGFKNHVEGCLEKKIFNGYDMVVEGGKKIKDSYFNKINLQVRVKMFFSILSWIKKEYEEILRNNSLEILNYLNKIFNLDVDISDIDTDGNIEVRRKYYSNET